MTENRLWETLNFDDFFGDGWGDGKLLQCRLSRLDAQLSKLSSQFRVCHVGVGVAVDVFRSRAQRESADSLRRLAYHRQVTQRIL